VSKYEGINKPNSELTDSCNIKTGKVRGKANSSDSKYGFIKSFLIRVFIGACIVGVVLGIGAIDVPLFNTITNTLRGVFGANFSGGGHIVSRDYYWLNNLVGGP